MTLAIWTVRAFPRYAARQLVEAHVECIRERHHRFALENVNL